jgi:replication factor C subunit 2/4
MQKNKLIWNEKYRPTNINKITNTDIKNLILSNNNLSNLQHLLFYGSSGIGKTTTALALCKYLFNNNPKYTDIYPKIINERVLELNASDERGIKVVREKIKIFASQSINTYENIVPFKIIILDEADTMTNDSQYALRRIIEQYSYITRFILICNYVTKIIAPLSSRFYKCKFNNININDMKIIIKNILTNEKINYDNFETIFKSIYEHSENDLRKAITILQRVSYISIINKCYLTEELINDTILVIPKEIINKLYKSLFIRENYHKISLNLLKDILTDGYVYDELLKQLSNLIFNDNEISDDKKSKIFIKMSEISNNLSNGSDELIQILILLSYINNIIINS